MPTWLTPIPGGIELSVLVQPRASRSKIVGEHDGMLKIQLAAPPVDGEANAELVQMLARLLGVPKRQVTLMSGETSRRKRVRVDGVETATALAAMNAGQ